MSLNDLPAGTIGNTFNSVGMMHSISVTPFLKASALLKAAYSSAFVTRIPCAP